MKINISFNNSKMQGMRNYKYFCVIIYGYIAFGLNKQLLNNYFP